MATMREALSAPQGYFGGMDNEPSSVNTPASRTPLMGYNAASDFNNMINSPLGYAVQIALPGGIPMGLGARQLQSHMNQAYTESMEDKEGANIGRGYDGGGETASSNDFGGDFDTGGVSAHEGGLVTIDNLVGPDPEGPDDGYGKLDLNEGILTAEAMEDIGEDGLNQLNKSVKMRKMVKALLG